MKPTAFAISLSLMLAACGGDEPPRQEATEDAQGDRSFRLLGDFGVPERNYQLRSDGESDALVDMDGDGLLDLVITGTDGLVFGDENQRYFEVHRNTGKGFASPAHWAVPVEIDRYGVDARDSSRCQGTWRWRLDDFDGDGLPDLLVTGVWSTACRATPFGGADAPQWLVYLNQGNGFAAEPRAIHLPADLPEQVEFTRWIPIVHHLDMNGDGIRDIVVTASTDTGDVFGHGEAPHWLVFLVDGFEILPAIEWSVPEGGTRCGYHLLEGNEGTEATYCPGNQESTWRVRDIDADGIPDLVVITPIRRGWFLHRGSDSGFGEAIDLPHPERIGSSYQAWEEGGLTFLDIDGDGKLDLIDTFGVYDPDFPSWRVYRGGDDGFQGWAEFYGVPEPVSRHGTDAISWNPCTWAFDCETPRERWMTADLNGDGRPELIVWDLQQPASTWTIWSLR